MTTEQSPITYHGNCHCGTVRFSIQLPRSLTSSPTQITQCNCSICTRNGYLGVHPPRSATTIHQGTESLSDYEFGNKNARHQFCKRCGSSLFMDPPPAVDILAVNIRMLQGVEDLLDEKRLEFKFHDGKRHGVSGPYKI